jgi:hypothetical protein
MISSLLAAAAIFAQAAPAAAPAAAADPAATPPAAQAPPSSAPHDVSGVTVAGAKKGSDQKEMVCHTEPVLGSMFPKKVCASREASAERRKNDQADVRAFSAIRPGVSN